MNALRPLVVALLGAPLMSSCKGDAPGGEPRSSEAVTSKAPREPLTAGQAAPDFTALSHTGYSVRLDDLLQKPVAVYFCPTGLDTSCEGLARALRDRWLTLNQRLEMVLLVTPTDYVTTQAFARTEELPFLLLTDHDRSIQESFGLAASSAPHGFLVGPARRILSAFVGPAGTAHVSELAQALP